MASTFSPPETDLLVVNLDQFQGPLDLLLHLIRKQDLDIFDIPVARITAQFLAAIADVDNLELERSGEFIEMAATLVRIKAQMLFPRRDADEDEDPRADLVRRLLEFEHFREIARLLDGEAMVRGRMRTKGFHLPRQRPPASTGPLETTWDEVWSAALAMAARQSAPQPEYKYHARPVRIEDKIDAILAALAQKRRLEFTTLVTPWGTRIHAVMSLLACLELAKRHALGLRQTAPFAQLWILRKDASDAA